LAYPGRCPGLKDLGPSGRGPPAGTPAQDPHHPGPLLPTTPSPSPGEEGDPQDSDSERQGWWRPEAEMLPDSRRLTPSRPPLLPVWGVGRGSGEEGRGDEGLGRGNLRAKLASMAGGVGRRRPGGTRAIQGVPVPADSLRGIRGYPRLGDAPTGGSPRTRGVSTLGRGPADPKRKCCRILVDLSRQDPSSPGEGGWKGAGEEGPG
jgi:hypothetical protein